MVLRAGVVPSAGGGSAHLFYNQLGLPTELAKDR